MEIAFFEVYEDWEREELKQHFPKATFFKEKIQDVDTIILEKYDIISVFIYSKVSEDILSQLPNLKLLSTRSTGFDHIDMKYCESKNIDVITVSHYGENTVAEFTFALLVNISRKIMPSVTRVKSGSFDFSGLQGFDLVGKTIGLIGFGRIGQKFAKMCIGFEMKVKVFDVNSHMESLQNVGEILGVEFAELDEIYSSCDIISLHVPLLPQTKHIINEDTIKKMRDGVIILNTSRGDLIKTHALFEALTKGKVGYVGLDVLENECMIKDFQEALETDENAVCDIKVAMEDQMIINHPNAFITPHNAFNTKDALLRIINSTVEQINEFMKK